MRNGIELPEKHINKLYPAVLDIYANHDFHQWYHHGMKWDLMDAINQDFDIYWKLFEPKNDRP